MLPDRVSIPGPLTYESGAPPIALRGPASFEDNSEIRFLISQREKYAVTLIRTVSVRQF